MRLNGSSVCQILTSPMSLADPEMLDLHRFHRRDKKTVLGLRVESRMHRARTEHRGFDKSSESKPTPYEEIHH